MSTNIEGVFDLILQTAKNHKLKNSDMPKKLYIVSDMEFDQASNKNSTIMDVIKEKYSIAGYTMPMLVFWNVASSGGNSPVRFDEKGVVLVSGYSTNIFKNIVGVPKAITPIDLMMDVLDGPRYKDINL